MGCGSSKNNRQRGYSVKYNSENHCEILFQLYGSVWPRVLPYCIFNTALSFLLDWLNISKGIDLGVSSKGHAFLGLVVAYLVVSRANVSIARYNGARSNLSSMYKSARELIQNALVLSNDDLSEQAQEWRFQVCYKTLMLLRCVTCVLMFEDSNIPCWELEEFDPEEARRLKHRLYVGDSTAMQWAHEARTEASENMRVPMLLSYELRTAIHAQRDNLQPPLELGQEMKLLASVDGFMGGYYGIRKFLTTPFPFALMQMGRTFLFLYVFTVPFALVDTSVNIIYTCILIFFFTFGFLGIEHVSIELDDPFGSDANDFDCLRMTYSAFEDTYTTLADVDGPKAADRLRLSMYVKSDEPLPEESVWLISASEQK